MKNTACTGGILFLSRFFRFFSGGSVSAFSRTFSFFFFMSRRIMPITVDVTDIASFNKPAYDPLKASYVTISALVSIPSAPTTCAMISIYPR